MNMKKLVLVVVSLCMTGSVLSKHKTFDLITDPTILTTATIGCVANAVPETIANNDTGLIFAFCINYLMIEEQISFERATKFAASYIAGAVIGRIIKAWNTSHQKHQKGRTTNLN